MAEGAQRAENVGHLNEEAAKKAARRRPGTVLADHEVRPVADSYQRRSEYANGSSHGRS